MNPVPLAQPTHYKIVYVDSKGESSTRVICPTSVSEESITGYCYHSHGIRTFKWNGIQTIQTTLNPQ